jgi:hypothetical protein
MWHDAAARSISRKVGKPVIVCRLPIIGKNEPAIQPIWQRGGNFCRLEGLCGF